MIKKFSITGFVLVFSLIVKSQNIDPSIFSKFPSGVINRLADVCGKQHISKEKQDATATIFKQEDSAVEAGLKNNIPYTQIALIRQSYQDRLRALLAPLEWQNYISTKNVLTSVDNYSRQMARYYIRRYNLDSINFYSGIYNHQKSQALFLLPLGNPFEMNDEMVDKFANYYNKDIQNMLYQLEGGLIYKELEDSLQKIKPLTGNTAARLKASFFNKCIVFRHKAYKEHFVNAMHDVITDTIYYAKWYKSDILNISETKTRQELSALMKKETVSQESLKKIRTIIYNKQAVNTLYYFTYNKYAVIKDSVTTQASRYYDSLVATELMKDGKFEHISLLSTAIRNRSKLQLRPTLTDTLISHAILLNNKWKAFEIKNPWGKFDAAIIESPDLDSLLTEEQFRQVLKIKNTYQSEEWAVNDWLEIKQRGLDFGIDSTSTVLSLKAFNNNLLMIKDRYAYNKEKLSNELTGVYSTMPGILKQLKSARSKSSSTAENAVNNKEALQKEQSLKNNFRW